MVLAIVLILIASVSGILIWKLNESEVLPPKLKCPGANQYANWEKNVCVTCPKYSKVFEVDSKG
jgi:hypothetical protein